MQAHIFAIVRRYSNTKSSPKTLEDSHSEKLAFSVIIKRGNKNREYDIFNTSNKPEIFAEKCLYFR